MKKMGEEDAVAVGELDWRVPLLDPLRSTVEGVAGETVDEKAPGSRAVVFTVDLWARW